MEVCEGGDLVLIKLIIRRRSERVVVADGRLLIGRCDRAREASARRPEEGLADGARELRVRLLTELEGRAMQAPLESDHEPKTDVFQGGNCRNPEAQEVEEEVQPLLSAHSESVGVFEESSVLPWQIQGRQKPFGEWQLGGAAHPMMG